MNRLDKLEARLKVIQRILLNLKLVENKRFISRQTETKLDKLKQKSDTKL